MKIFSKKILFAILSAFSGIVAFAQDPLPPGPPPPPGDDIPVVPIDENLFILLLIALLFGIYIIYSHRFKTKTPI